VDIRDKQNAISNVKAKIESMQSSDVPQIDLLHFSRRENFKKHRLTNQTYGRNKALLKLIDEYIKTNTEYQLKT
jgi:hypothetical protein